MVLSKSALLAAPALLYPIWSPWIRAGARNLEVYTKSLKCLGLWRATVRGALHAVCIIACVAIPVISLLFQQMNP